MIEFCPGRICRIIELSLLFLWVKCPPEPVILTLHNQWDSILVLADFFSKNKKKRKTSPMFIPFLSFSMSTSFFFSPPCICACLAVICLYHGLKFHWEHENKNEKSWSSLKLIQNIGQFWKFVWPNRMIFCFLYKNMIITLQNCKNDTSKGPKIIQFTLNDILIWWNLVVPLQPILHNH